MKIIMVLLVTIGIASTVTASNLEEEFIMPEKIIPTRIHIIYEDGRSFSVHTLNNSKGVDLINKAKYAIRGVKPCNNTNFCEFMFDYVDGPYRANDRYLINFDGVYAMTVDFNSDKKTRYVCSINGNTYRDSSYDIELMFKSSHVLSTHRTGGILWKSSRNDANLVLSDWKRYLLDNANNGFKLYNFKNNCDSNTASLVIKGFDLFSLIYERTETFSP